MHERKRCSSLDLPRLLRFPDLISPPPPRSFHSPSRQELDTSYRQLSVDLSARREEIMGVIERLRDTARLPILLVTHDAGEAARLGTRIVTM